jgi:hypothetical protein
MQQDHGWLAERFERSCCAPIAPRCSRPRAAFICRVEAEKIAGIEIVVEPERPRELGRTG